MYIDICVSYMKSFRYITRTRPKRLATVKPPHVPIRFSMTPIGVGSYPFPAGFYECYVSESEGENNAQKITVLPTNNYFLLYLKVPVTDEITITATKEAATEAVIASCGQNNEKYDDEVEENGYGVDC
ncbi:hypothetical protein HELRODRAFT_178492 [Helobdella robusta]|uniref:Uncharacterized protein n=1 Tax=Helobdella robusta TaxID=6412 RepID=T1FD92_HELRO|nr:hypothetical protein HELRODRAFT_178492 [Helobdella robusta]ESN97046.1 hypothetical protein HELRODRAFT_178492 [Helobdella robusta]